MKKLGILDTMACEWAFNFNGLFQEWSKKRVTALFEEWLQENLPSILTEVRRDLPDFKKVTFVPSYENKTFFIRYEAGLPFHIGMLGVTSNVLTPMYGVKATFDSRGNRI